MLHTLFTRDMATQSRELVNYSRSLVFERINPRHFATVHLVHVQIRMFGQFVLSNAHVVSSAFDVEEITDCRPKFIFPSDEIVFNATNRKTVEVVENMHE